MTQDGPTAEMSPTTCDDPSHRAGYRYRPESAIHEVVGHMRTDLTPEQAQRVPYLPHDARRATGDECTRYGDSLRMAMRRAIQGLDALCEMIRDAESDALNLRDADDVVRRYDFDGTLSLKSDYGVTGLMALAVDHSRVSVWRRRLWGSSRPDGEIWYPAKRRIFVSDWPADRLRCEACGRANVVE